MDGILLINKEKDMTSHDVVNILRRKLGTKRVGHTGTLDPNATGLLLMLVGRYTKLTPFLLSEWKTYDVEMLFGQKTDTYDVWGNIIESRTVEEIDFNEIKSVLNMFIGTSLQTPPIYSAIKLKGKKLYEYARENKEVVIEPRKINIESISITNYNHPYLSFSVRCSSGTYIRSLCVDIAEKLQTIACMSGLVRTSINGLTIEDSIKMDDVSIDSLALIDPLGLLKEFTIVDVDDPINVYHGKPISVNSKSETILISYKGEPLAFYQHLKDDVYISKRGLW